MFLQDIRQLNEMDIALSQRFRFSSQIAWENNLLSCRYEFLDFVKQVRKIRDGNNGFMAQIPFLMVGDRTYIHTIVSHKKVIWQSTPYITSTTVNTFMCKTNHIKQLIIHSLIFFYEVVVSRNIIIQNCYVNTFLKSIPHLLNHIFEELYPGIAVCSRP